MFCSVLKERIEWKSEQVLMIYKRSCLAIKRFLGLSLPLSLPLSTLSGCPPTSKKPIAAAGHAKRCVAGAVGDGQLGRGGEERESPKSGDRELLFELFSSRAVKKRGKKPEALLLLHAADDNSGATTTYKVPTATATHS